MPSGWWSVCILLVLLFTSANLFILFTYSVHTKQKSGVSYMKHPRHESKQETKIPLYIITPTYPRAEQIPELTRLAQSLMNVPNIVWIVSEDADVISTSVVEYLQKCPFNTVYIRTRMPKKYWKRKKKPRGVANRIAGLQWVLKHAKTGVLYFADDDNTYDIRIFEEIRSTQKVSMFPVGLVTHLGVSTPIVKDGRVVGFYDGWIVNRKFPVDMAGFAVSVQFLRTVPKPSMPYKVGYEEDAFLRSLQITMEDIEPKADNCTKILVWHTKTVKNRAALIDAKMKIYFDTNLKFIQKQLWTHGGSKTCCRATAQQQELGQNQTRTDDRNV